MIESVVLHAMLLMCNGDQDCFIKAQVCVKKHDYYSREFNKLNGEIFSKCFMEVFTPELLEQKDCE